jgi:UDP-3-O-[3-hydroxymyristoyl] glucosamine N-acyltransferase
MKKKTVSLSLLASSIGARLENAPEDIIVSGVTTLAQANAEEVSFFSNHLYRKELSKTQAAAVILAEKDKSHCPVPVLVIENPYLGYARAALFFVPEEPHISYIHERAWVSPLADVGERVFIGAQTIVDESVILGDDVFIGHGCVIEKGVKIGNFTRLNANVTICSGTEIGQRVLIHSGAVIGSDGFGLANDNGIWVKVPQLGGVRIEDDVEIGANTTVDKGALENTVIGKGSKLDNQIQIAHNVQIGENTVIAGCVGIAGSTKIGNFCMIGGGVGIVGHIEIADHVQITGGSIVLQSIKKSGTYSSGTPLEPNFTWRRNYNRLKQLDEIFRQLKEMKN